MPREAGLLAFALALALACLSGCATASGPSEVRTSGAGFLVVGDTGYVTERGVSGMMPVANAMFDFCRSADCRFGLFAGDNIYPDGAAGDATDAALFQSRFITPYGRFAGLGSDFRFYVALGNHDWHSSRAGALSQADFHRRTPPFHMGGLFYSVEPPGLEGQVEIFVVDTEMLLSPLTLPDYDAAPDGSMIRTDDTDRGGGANALPQTPAERSQLAWLEAALGRSSARWKLVVGHHPLWQSVPDSKYAQSVALRELLLPMLCRHADAYFAGHQHTLEVAADRCSGENATETVPPLPNVVSGAGGKAREISPAFRAWQQSAWPQVRPLWASGGEWGFAYVSLVGSRMEVRMMQVDGEGRAREAFRHSFSDRPDVPERRTR